MWALFLWGCASASAQESPSPEGFSTEAGWIGMVVSVIVGTVMAAERLKGTFGSSPPQLTSSEDDVDLQPLTSRLTLVETRLQQIETTVSVIDERNRSEAASVARLEGRVEDWGDRLGRIEVLVQRIAARRP